MKKVIDGALYNTDTAQMMGDWDNGLYANDFGFCRERLYRTKSGKYFLHGEGGANSRYGEWHGNSGGSGEQIRPYTLSEAMEWAEEHLDGDEYIAIFGKPEEIADGREALNITVPADLKASLDRLKSEKGKSISQLIEAAVREQYGI